jgi:transcriptional regulator with XRE-family HTH domain
VNQNLSLRFKELRRIRGVSGVAIAHQMGVSKAYISQIENGKRTNVEPAKLLKLASKLAVNSQWLLTGFGDPSAGITPPSPSVISSFSAELRAPDSPPKENVEISCDGSTSLTAGGRDAAIGAAIAEAIAALQRVQALLAAGKEEAEAEPEKGRRKGKGQGK